MAINTKELLTSPEAHTGWQIAAGTWVATTLSDKVDLIDWNLTPSTVVILVATALGIGLSKLKNVLKRRREQPNQNVLVQAALDEALERIAALEGK